MPTLVATFGSKAKSQSVNGARALLDFYSVIAVAILALLVLEAYSGMFDGQSAAQALLTATGTPLTPDAFVSAL